ncbi:MAG: hypothetical protein JXJ04_21935 [Spirochaetales bacterium]|nr:hypothetical protein [Spirochaetales bacterium]
MFGSREADDTLALKGNQATRHEDIKLFLDGIENNNKRKTSFDYCKTIDKDPGRVERRDCFITSDLDWLIQKDQWIKLISVIIIKY